MYPTGEKSNNTVYNASVAGTVSAIPTPWWVAGLRVVEINLPPMAPASVTPSSSWPLRCGGVGDVLAGRCTDLQRSRCGWFRPSSMLRSCFQKTRSLSPACSPFFAGGGSIAQGFCLGAVKKKQVERFRPPRRLTPATSVLRRFQPIYVRSRPAYRDVPFLQARSCLSFGPVTVRLVRPADCAGRAVGLVLATTPRPSPRHRSWR